MGVQLANLSDFLIMQWICWLQVTTYPVILLPKEKIVDTNSAGMIPPQKKLNSSFKIVSAPKDNNTVMIF